MLVPATTGIAARITALIAAIVASLAAAEEAAQEALSLRLAARIAARIGAGITALIAAIVASLAAAEEAAQAALSLRLAARITARSRGTANGSRGTTNGSRGTASGCRSTASGSRGTTTSIMVRPAEQAGISRVHTDATGQQSGCKCKPLHFQVSPRNIFRYRIRRELQVAASKQVVNPSAGEFDTQRDNVGNTARFFVIGMIRALCNPFRFGTTGQFPVKGAILRIAQPRIRTEEPEQVKNSDKLSESIRGRSVSCSAKLRWLGNAASHVRRRILAGGPNRLGRRKTEIGSVTIGG